MSRVFKNVAPLLFVFFLWHVFTLIKVLDPAFFPSPVMIFKRLYELKNNASFLLDLKASFIRYALAQFIGLSLGFFLAFICSHSKKMDQFFNPLVAMSFPLPKVAIMPLLLVLLGIDNASKIALISLGVFFLFFVQLRKAMMSLKEKKYREVIHVYQIKGSDYFFHVLLKGIYLDFLVGLKTAFSYGLTLVVVSEMTVSRNGIGHFIWRAWDAFLVLDMYAAIFFLSAVGLILYLLIDGLIKKELARY